MAELNLSFLGGVGISLNGAHIADMGGRKALALLCYLAVNRQSFSRESLAGLLWGEMPDESARMNLRRTLSRLRPFVGPHLQITTREIAFNRKAPYWLDVEQFETAVASSKSDINLLRKALDLYQGDFLDGFYIKNAPTFEEWTLSQRAKLRGLTVQTLHTLVTNCLQQSAFSDGITYAHRLLSLDPWREETHRQMMELLIRDGQRGAALMQFDSCRRILAKELGVDPAPATRALYEQIIQGKISSKLTQTVSSLTVSLFKSNKEPFVARTGELARLLNLLDNANAKQGTLSFVIGEAGSGKSSLLSAFIREARLHHSNLTVLQGQCNAFSGSGDAYLPFREVLAQLFDDPMLNPPQNGQFVGPPERNAILLETFLKYGPHLANTFISPGALIEWAERTERKEGWIEAAKQQIKQISQENLQLNLPQQVLFEQFVSVMGVVSKDAPLILIIDDLQWADRGSVDLLFHLGRQLGRYRIVLLGAYRIEDVALGRKGEPHPLQVVMHELQKQFGDIFIDLDRVEKRPFINAYLDLEPNELDEQFRKMLLQRTGGHPLFMVELLRAMQQREELIKNRFGKWIVKDMLDWSKLPARVEGAIGERVYRLDTTLHQILNVASIEGEFFTAEVIAHVLGIDAEEVVTRLSQEGNKVHRLVRARDVVRTTKGRISTYQFRHIIIQEYLYNRLDVVERKHRHEAVAGALELFHENLDDMAVIIAKHFQLAGMNDKAIAYLQRAGIKAVHRYAHHEATTLINEALDLLKLLPDGQERDKLELDLQLLLGPTKLLIEGYAGKGVIPTYSRAYALNQKIEDNPGKVGTLSGLWVYYLVKGDLARALELARDLLTFTHENGDTKDQIAARFAMLTSLFFEGRFKESILHGDKAADSYQIAFHNDLFQRFGHDPGLASKSYSAFSLSLLGYLDQALSQITEAVTLNREIGNPYNLSFALNNLALVHHIRDDPDQAIRVAEESITLASKHGFVQSLAHSLVIKGWCLVQFGNTSSGLQEIKQGAKMRYDTGAELAKTHFLWVLAEAYGVAGNIERGLEIVEEALTFLEEGGKFWLAEVYRTKGEFMWRSGQSTDAVEDQYKQAIIVARNQQAKLFELRAACSLGQFYLSNDRHAEARKLVEGVLNWFTEGFDTADLRKANSILKIVSP
jgi:DNA-binding SARP family transcriptional activator/predicted ATPase